MSADELTQCYFGADKEHRACSAWKGKKEKFPQNRKSCLKDKMKDGISVGWIYLLPRDPGSVHNLRGSVLYLVRLIFMATII